MIKRDLTADITKALTYFPVVGIIGPRQVGKTTLAKSIRHCAFGNALFSERTTKSM